MIDLTPRACKKNLFLLLKYKIMVDVILGLQWGDEGKGKIVDYFAPNYDVIARFQGGPNAGHTLYVNGTKMVLHQIPSGIFRQEVQNIIGNGVVLDPIIFKKEIDGLAHFNLDLRKNLEISKKASIILPTHRLLDAAYEKAKGDAKIGSTLKGIGPTYTDKISRQGLRVGDMISPNFPEKYAALVGAIEITLQALCVVILLASLFVMSNVIRASVQSRKDEIVVLEMIGATPSMIRKPFMMEGAFLGVSSSVLAMGLCFVVYIGIKNLLTTKLSFLQLGQHIQFLGPMVLVAFVLVGTALGALGSYLCVRRINDGFAGSQGT